ncbi:MAG TPA: signal peptidase I [Cyclobacteriaceae bacterium]|jgi:signal peptidase I|nr:signal peptidase I [Cyclobacteriaceae bacterium]
MIKRRKPFSALLLSIIPGLGQIYNGQLRKGLIFLIIDLLVPVIFGLAGILNNLNGLVILVVLSISFIVYRMTDGFIQAKKLIDYELKSYNRWYIYLLFAIALSIVRIFLDFPTSTGIQTFKISGPSMNSTMQPGDRVVANLNYYNNNQVQQGDIVVFNSPQGGIWTFRVVGLPNDSIEIKDGKVYVNGQLNELTVTKEYTLDNQDVIEYQEKINPTKTIKTLRDKKNLMLVDTQTFEKIRIPDNEYFLMGDNRDNAYDSRFIGTIKKENILGRVIYSYWGNASDRINIDFKKE